MKIEFLGEPLKSFRFPDDWVYMTKKWIGCYESNDGWTFIERGDDDFFTSKMTHKIVSSSPVRILMRRINE